MRKRRRKRRGEDGKEGEGEKSTPQTERYLINVITTDI